MNRASSGLRLTEDGKIIDHTSLAVFLMESTNQNALESTVGWMEVVLGSMPTTPARGRLPYAAPRRERLAQKEESDASLVVFH